MKRLTDAEFIENVKRQHKPLLGKNLKISVRNPGLIPVTYHGIIKRVYDKTFEIDSEYPKGMFVLPLKGVHVVVTENEWFFPRRRRL